ncbi:MAG: AAA family ATPase [Armatimonadota bacterium]
MLIEFSVGNYKSFKETVTLSMVAANRLASRDRALDENTVIPIDDELSLLTSAAVYGANASGKSNLGDAFRFMQDFIINSSKDTQVGERIAVEPFALDPETHTQPTHFEIVFIIAGNPLIANKQYRYGFEVDAKRVVREWLYHVPKRKEVMLFERDGQKFTLSPTFAEGEKLEAKTRENALFLSVVAQFNGQIAADITKWFVDSHFISGLDNVPPMRWTVAVLLHSNRFQEEVLKFVHSLDFGIEGIQVEESNIITLHRSYNAAGDPSSLVSFDLESQESEGTKKIIALAGEIILSLRLGDTFIIDEFDARFHPLLTQEIVRLFNNKETNPKHAQLIFMTHDTNLLDRELLRRDQIWFVEKDRFGASHLYSLAELRARNDTSYEKNYIQGRYGAIPFLGDVQRVMEEIDA